MSFLKKTMAVVVLYNEKINDSQTLISLDRGLDEGEQLDLIIYDNSKAFQEVKNSTFKKFNIKYFHNPKNPGVSLAYNYGAKQAKRLNKQWLLILDQDTMFSTDFLKKMKEAIVNNNEIKLFSPILKLSNDVILSPCSFKYFHGRHLNKVPLGKNALSNNQPVNSGIIVSLDIFMKAGGYNDKVTLDYSDHQFIERFKKIEKNYFVINSVGQQNFSGSEMDIKKVLIRFKYFCSGALNFETNKFYNSFFLHFFLVLKLIKNTVQHRTPNFFKIYFNELSNSIKG